MDLSESSDFSDNEIDWVGQVSVDEDDAKQEITSPEFETNQEEEAVAGPSVKKTKWNVKFNKEWSKTYSWIVRGKDVSQAKCTFCESQFTINHGGENDIIKHMKTEKHKKNTTKGSQEKKLDTFFSKNNLDKDLTAQAECAFVFHCIKHAHSYLSGDCAGKLFRTIFQDSKIAERYSCGRTKATKLVTNILGPESKNVILNDLANNQPFCIATDASNKGNVKTFPLVIRYIKKDTGVCTKLLKFYSTTSEQSVDIANSLVKGLTEAGLNILNVTAYCADNASVNFGKNQSVITELNKLNQNIVPVGCICHIIHNAGKHGQVALKYDVESIVIKCYNEFSSSTKKVNELKEFFIFCEEEWSDLLRSVPTRWLSLIPAIERLLKHFAPVKSYFQSQERPPPTLEKFFEDELAEAYLGLLLNIGNSMHITITKLESEKTLAIELFNIMQSLRSSLKLKMEQQFYGSIALSLLRKCNDHTRVSMFKREADVLLERIINYLEKWYNFNDDNKFRSLSAMTLQNNPNINDFLKICEDFHIIEINEDLLFEEYVTLRNFMENCLVNLDELTADKQWVAYFQKNNAPNFSKICSVVFSLPHSNAMSERIFNLMGLAWRKERNRLDIKTLEAELMVKHNFNQSCYEFAKFLKSRDGARILTKVKSSEKY